MFREAENWEYLEKNPAGKVKFLKLPKPTIRFLTDEEIDDFLHVCGESKSQHLYPVVFTALRTGMRRGEIFHLRWADVDFKRNVISVVAREDHQTKNYDSRTIPMTPALFDELRRQPRRLDSEYVFWKTDGKPLNKLQSFERAVRRAMRIDKMPYFRFHDLRHTFASHLVMKGVDIRTVQVLLGHQDIRMTMRYAHLAPDHLKNSVNLLEKDCEDKAAYEEGVGDQ
jgi:integrase